MCAFMGYTFGFMKRYRCDPTGTQVLVIMQHGPSGSVSLATKHPGSPIFLPSFCTYSSGQLSGIPIRRRVLWYRGRKTDNIRNSQRLKSK